MGKSKKTCKGSIELATACGKCKRCLDQFAAIEKKKQTPTPAEKRYSEALVYLHSNDIDINSRTDVFYKKALKIAAGVNRENNE